jgi:hypothetical protein
VGTKGAFPYLALSGIVHQHVIGTSVKAFLTAIATLIIYEHYPVLALVYGFGWA